MKKLFTEPLLHFFLIGALLFFLYGWLNDEESGGSEEIVVSAAVLDQIDETFQRTWQRPPTEQEKKALIDGWVREEILYRQGVAIGFDQGDPVIRRRVAQKMNFVADGMTPQSPTDEMLNAWLESNLEDYEIPPTYTFDQIYINPEKHAADLDAHLESTFELLQGSAGARTDIEALGDSIMLPPEVVAASPRDIERIFGLEFAAAIAGQEVGSWQGPVISGYGLHFVRVQESVPGKVPKLDEVRAEVERDFLDDQATQISDSFYQALRDRYTVRIEARNGES